MEQDLLRVCSDFVVHGERIELVDGKPKPIGSSFRLWLEIENRADVARHLSPPSITAGTFSLPVSRWYLEGTSRFTKRVTSTRSSVARRS